MPLRTPAETCEQFPYTMRANLIDAWDRDRNQKCWDWLYDYVSPIAVRWDWYTEDNYMCYCFKTQEDLVQFKLACSDLFMY